MHIDTVAHPDNVNQCWKMIATAGWVESGHDYGSVERHLITTYSRTQLIMLGTFVSERWSELSNRLDRCMSRYGNYGGDDSYGDMINHVIGMGKLSFETYMEYPERLNDLDFVESFSYGVPNKHSLDEVIEQYDPAYHRDNAQKALQELYRIKTQNSPDDKEMEVICELQNRFLSMQEGDFNTALKGFEKYEPGIGHKLYARYWQWPQAEHDTSRPGADYGQANDMHAYFANTLTDAKKVDFGIKIV